MIQRTRSDVENGMRANACPSDKADGKGERRSGHATSSIQKGKERKNSIEFVEEGREDFLLIYALKMPIDIYRYCHSRAAARLHPCLVATPET